MLVGLPRPATLYPDAAVKYIPRYGRTIETILRICSPTLATAGIGFEGSRGNPQ